MTSFHTSCNLHFVINTDVPGAPGKPTVSDIEATAMRVKWTPPASDGGSGITGYVVQQKEKLALRWTPVNEIPVMETTYKVTGLTTKNEYEFRVVAANKAGFGPPSDSSGVFLAKPPYGKYIGKFNTLWQEYGQLATQLGMLIQLCF